MQVWTTMADIIGQSTRGEATLANINDRFDFTGISSQGLQKPASTEALKLNIETTEENLSTVGQEVVALVDSKMSSAQLYEGDSKLLANKASIDFSEEDRDKIKEYFKLLNEHKGLTGKDTYATGENAQSVMQKLTTLLTVTSDNDPQALLDAQKAIFQKQKTLIETNVKLPSLSSKVSASAADVRNTVFSILNPDLNSEERFNARLKLAASLIRSVGIENFAQNSSVNGQSVGIFAAVEKMFDLGGKDSGIGKKWLDNFKMVLEPIFTKPLDYSNELAELDRDTLDYVKQIRTQLSKPVIEKLEANTKLMRAAYGRENDEGRAVNDRSDTVFKVIESFGKAYNIGEEVTDGEKRNWNDEFQYQIAKLALSFAETKRKVAESTGVVDQLKDAARSKEPVHLIKNVPIERLSSEMKREVLTDSLLNAFDEYKKKSDRLVQLQLSGSEDEKVSQRNRYTLTGQQFLDTINGYDGKVGAVYASGDSYKIKNPTDSSDISIHKDVYNALLNTIKNDFEAKPLSGSDLTNIIDSVKNNLGEKAGALLGGPEDLRTQTLANFIRAVSATAMSREADSLAKDIDALNARDKSDVEANSVYTKAISLLDITVPESEGSPAVAKKSLSDFTDRAELQASIASISDQQKINDSIASFGGKAVVKLSKDNVDLRSGLLKAFEAQKKEANDQLRDDTKLRRELSSAFVKAVHERGFVSMAAHQGNEFLRLITDDNLEEGVLDSSKLEKLFDRKSILDTGEAGKAGYLRDLLLSTHNQSNLMNKAMQVHLSNEQTKVLGAFLGNSQYRATFDNIKEDFIKATGVSIADNASTKVVIGEVLGTIDRLSQNLGIKFSADAQDRLDMLRNYREGDELSEIKARLALKKTLNGFLSTIKEYKGDNSGANELKQTVYSQNVDVMEGNRLRKFNADVLTINNKYESSMQEYDPGSWSKANSVADVIANEKDSPRPFAQVAHHMITDFFKALVSTFIGSKDDNVQAYNTEINTILKRPDNNGHALQDLVQDVVTTGLSTVN